MNIRSFHASIATLCVVGVLLFALTSNLLAQTSSPHQSSRTAQSGISEARKKQLEPVLTLMKQGLTQLRQKQYDKGFRTLTTALGMVKGTDAPANSLRAMLYSLRIGVCEYLHRDRQEVADIHALLALPMGDRVPKGSLAMADNELAWLLASSPDTSVQNGKEAVRYAKQALALIDKEHSAFIVDTLAAAEARAGDFAQAVTQQQLAITLTHEARDKADMQQRLHLYQQQKPFTGHYKVVSAG